MFKAFPYQMTFSIKHDFIDQARRGRQLWL